MKSKIQMTSLLISLSFFQPILTSGSFAHAKRRKAVMRAFSFITTDGKASQGECDGETKIPRKLRHLKEVPKADSYMGSELIDSDFKDKADEELWKHFFRNKPSCNASLAKAPSSLGESQKKNKPDLPPEEAPDASQAEEESGRSGSEE